MIPISNKNFMKMSSHKIPNKRKRDSENHSRLSDLDDDVNWDEWTSATKTKNFMMDDTFLDYIKYSGKSVGQIYPNLLVKSTQESTNTKSFQSNIMQMGIKFEEKVVDLMIHNMGSENFINIGGDDNARSLQKYQNTIKAMTDGIPFIYQGIVRNYENKSFGAPDLIIRSDWINKFLDLDVYSNTEGKISAPLLKKRVKVRGKYRECSPKYHYVIVDVKYKTLMLRSDGKHLRNDGNLKAYKSQLLIYTDALAKMQGYNPQCAFILGSKWKFTSCGIEYEGKSCFSILGKIDYKKLDKSYIKKTKEALEWWDLLRKDGDKWDLKQRPLPRPELYPNMCNSMDYPYRRIKSKFAEEIDEISLLWYVGPKERRNAHNLGIYSWKDSKCTPEALGIKSKKRPIVLNRILDTNRKSKQIIQPKYFNKNIGDWKNPKPIELFVDFEMNNPVLQDFSDLPNFTNQTIIFMIGAGYIDPDTKEWVYKEFVVNYMIGGEEMRICSDFLTFVQVLKRKFNLDSIPTYHWSKAEVSSWRRAANRYQHKTSMLFSDVEWVDLYDIFREEPVGVKGCLNYSLKNIAKTFHKNKFIRTIWDQNGACVNGADAAVEAYQIEKECYQKNIKFVEHPLTDEIVKYNEVDCKVLQEMLYYIRKHHIAPNDMDVEKVDKEIFGRSKRKRRKVNYKV